MPMLISLISHSSEYLSPNHMLHVVNTHNPLSWYQSANVSQTSCGYNFKVSEIMTVFYTDKRKDRGRGTTSDRGVLPGTSVNIK